MERVKIILPKKLVYTTEIPILIQHLNYGNHVGNDSVVSILHESRVRFLAAHHCTELNIGGVGLIMADLAIQYLKQIHYNDIIVAKLYIGETSPTSFSLYYQLCLNNNMDQAAVLARTNMICFDYEKQKISKLPERFQEII